MADRPLRSAPTKTPTWTELNELTSSSLGGEVNVLESSFLCWRCSFVHNGFGGVKSSHTHISQHFLSSMAECWTNIRPSLKIYEYSPWSTLIYYMNHFWDGPSLTIDVMIFFTDSFCNGRLVCSC